MKQALEVESARTLQELGAAFSELDDQSNGIRSAAPSSGAGKAMIKKSKAGARGMSKRR